MNEKKKRKRIIVELDESHNDKLMEIAKTKYRDAKVPQVIRWMIEDLYKELNIEAA